MFQLLMPCRKTPPAFIAKICPRHQENAPSLLAWVRAHARTRVEGLGNELLIYETKLTARHMQYVDFKFELFGKTAACIKVLVIPSDLSNLVREHEPKQP